MLRKRWSKALLRLVQDLLYLGVLILKPYKPRRIGRYRQIAIPYHEGYIMGGTFTGALS